MKKPPRMTATKEPSSGRTETQLRTIVQLRESSDEVWKEVTDVTVFSRNGAGFSLSRECKVGQLLMLVMPMPREFRAYDLDEELYPVIGIVQNCYRASSPGGDLYHIGVGFIGKNAPESYKANPSQNYRIGGLRPDGMWQIVESETPFKRRKHSRFGHSLGVTISLIQKERKSVTKEETLTKDVCTTGASVFSSLDARVGDRVKFGCKEHNFYALAIVRNRQESKLHLPTLHLEFIENEFPVEKLTSETYPMPAPDNDVANALSARPEPEATPPPSHTHDPGQFEFRRF